MSEQRESLHGGWLGQKMPGGGCPRQCRVLPEREKKGGGGMWVRCSRIDKKSGEMGCRGWCGAVARERQKVKAPC
jgi:hypothetical protein